ncbi:MAG TPA: hypothetical protein DD662_04345 [Planctomycetaceae bacterium]|nr:hypothetical protein [Planctomycetaceae bacterium]
MHYVFIGLIVILLLAGATALVLGRQGINRTTLIFAGLVLVATAGFIYLAGRVAERERAWRETIRDTTAEINTTLYGEFAGKTFFLADRAGTDDPNEITELRHKILQLGGTLSPSKTIRSSVDVVVVDDLDKIPPRAQELNIEAVDQAKINDAIARTLGGLNTAIITKQREQTRLETWRNRNWKTALFKPPKVEPDTSKPGLYRVVEDGALQLTLSAKDTDQPLNEGAELAIFNLQTDDERGFLGVFSIQTVSNREENILSLSISPLTTPDEYDLAAWKDWGLTSRAAKNPQVAVYEDLPTSSELSVDALTALRGTEVKTGDSSITSGGLEGMRRDLIEELSTIGSMIDSVGLAKAATERERDRKKQTASDLKSDRDAWEEDKQFAQDALERLESRSSRLQQNLRDTRTRIFELRTELTELNGRLMAEGNRETQAIQKSSAASGTTALR